MARQDRLNVKQFRPFSGIGQWYFSAIVEYSPFGGTYQSTICAYYCASYKRKSQHSELTFKAILFTFHCKRRTSHHCKMFFFYHCFTIYCYCIPRESIHCSISSISALFEKRFPSSQLAFGDNAFRFSVLVLIPLPPEVQKFTSVFPEKS